MQEINQTSNTNKTSINNVTGKKVAFLTLGCKVNSYETEAMQQLFLDAGATIVDFEELSDIYVVNTCTVTNIADRKSRQMLHKAKKNNPNSVVIAVGCYVQAAKEALLEDDTVDLVIGNNKKNEIVSLVDEYYDNQSNYAVIDIDNDFEYEELAIAAVTEKTRAYIKIQDGCNQFCSYCIIPYARGRIRSRSEEEIKKEVMRLVENGYQEIVLTGIHLSSYGLETLSVKEQAALLPENGISPLMTLILSLSEIEGLNRIRLSSLEPRIITEEFVKTLARSKLCPHFHLSLQSGCKETLVRMNRKYTPDDYYKRCEIIRTYYENPAITTDVIVGFPGETEEEFEDTKAFLEKVQFSQMHIFKYSKRKGTKAEAMPNQVPEQIKSKRSENLFDSEKKMRAKYLDSFIGINEIVLTEEETMIEDTLYMIGHTTRYVKVAIPVSNLKSNELVNVRITGYLNEDVMLSEIID
ncbi:tRNA (N(6)-L-threonylcarbamoyladenosine(37)-C(2))-methylthiotransferase MtaB [Lachnoclostridium phytofermentans]|uniref:Threonylcarbamoyladenosine tRNA methylthiotransferase MtaB n=1 Tax=Lachnoclostridium phytofermentans (strain ATCC 700394 / DSM 18823 / ISDg) TaxID=357809 RepID=A9KKS8_LACP7|nr:tRNA (N(6)-L-threonylcarbamoyladenosine(37)-C(2))-methylthiotransferase MtaB [Lachnoclostridium phytofermentans]ABX42660.1 MiaB-like tRNA modifying enzyme [Lachnoclostridium phytofermentans ISDg]